MYNPLVSITVCTYNSGKTVLETLDSIKEQTYQNIELIISDDCSTDNTVQLCKEWLKEHESRFVRTLLIESEINTGVSSNANRAIGAIKGEWKKGIAGDDIMEHTCVADFVNYVKEHPDSKVIFSRCKLFRVVNGKKIFCGEIPNETDVRYYGLPVEMQKIFMYYWKFPFPGPVAFINTEIFKHLVYDVKYDAFEDYPFYMRIVESGIHIDYMDKVTTLWRQGESACHSDIRLVNPRLQRSKDMYFLDCQYNLLKEKYPEIFRYRMALHFVNNFKQIVLNNKISYKNRAILKLLRLLLKKDLHFDYDEVIHKYHEQDK